MKAKFLAKLAEAKDKDLLALVADEANFYIWREADLGDINSAYFKRDGELSAAK